MIIDKHGIPQRLENYFNEKGELEAKEDDIK
jgi:hypothetical protein